MTAREDNPPGREPGAVGDDGRATAEPAALLETAQLEGIVAAAGPAGAAEIMEAFWRTARQLLEQLHASAAVEDFAAAAAAAHALKGSAANVGAGALSETTRRLETACLDGDGRAGEERLAEARARFSQTETAFTQYLGAGGTQR